MVHQRGLSDPRPGNYRNDIYIRVYPCIVEKSDIVLSAKNIAACNGKVATEIFFGASRDGGQRATAYELPIGIWRKL